MSISNRMFPLQKIAVWIMGTMPMVAPLWRIRAPHLAFFPQILGFGDVHHRKRATSTLWLATNSGAVFGAFPGLFHAGRGCFSATDGALEALPHGFFAPFSMGLGCGSACKRDPVSGVIGV